MAVNSDINHLTSFLQNSQEEMTQLNIETWNKYSILNRIDSFLSNKNYAEIQKIKDQLYETLADPFLTEDQLEKSMDLLRYL